MQYIIAIGIFQALAAAAFLWTSRSRQSADHLLILLLGCIAVHLGIKFFIYNAVSDAEVRHQMNTFIGLCYGPLLYLYTVKVRDNAFIPAARWYVFLPFITGTIAYFTVASVLCVSTVAGYRILHIYNEVSFWVMTASLFFVLPALQIARGQLKHMQKERNMIIRLSSVFLTIGVLSLLFYFIGWKGEKFNIHFRSCVYAMLTAQCVLIIRYKYEMSSSPADAGEQIAPAGISTPDAYIAVSVAEVPSIYEAMQPTEHTGRKMALSAEEQRKIWERLELFQQQKRVFTDSELTLDRLAQLTGISKYHISETLNVYAQKTFYQYINEYRINYTLRQMQSMQEKSLPVNMLLLAYDAGFKAKSSFNRYFKEIVGATPTEYLKILQGSSLDAAV